MLLSLTAVLNLELEHLDVKTAFLHGNIDERIFLEQPIGYVKEGDEGKVCLL